MTKEQKIAVAVLVVTFLLILLVSIVRDGTSW
jgi:hypothetical protein